MAKKPVKITEVVLRDAHQSLLATRMTMDEMRPILPEMDKIPYFSVECWGGATFDSCIRFLDEDPWERLRILRKELPHQKLQMLFRGQNMLGYRPYADDAVQYFVQKSVANGIDVIRIFDALNDPRNLKTAIEAANKEKAHVQACISYTLSPVHNNEYFAKYAKTLEEMGADSICIKDMAGLLKPYTCAELVSELKKTVSIPVDIHSHYTAGLASMSILKGIEAGADIVDTAMSPLALGTSHMPTESLVAALQGTDYDTGLDLNQLNVVRAYFAKLREKYIANGQINPKSLGVDANTLLYQQLAQCRAIYDKNAETILGNMDSVLFLGGREASTIKEISENWLGKATISMQTEGRSRGQSESYSQNTQRLGRELMTPSELATMPGDRCILQLRGLPPFYSKKYDLKQHPNYRFTAEADKVKNAFDLDRLIDRHRRPGMNEECEVYEVSVPDEALTDEDEDILNYDDLDDPDAFV